MDRIAELTEKIKALETRATEAVAAAESEPAKIEEFKAILENDIKPQLTVLTKEREDALQGKAVEDLKGEVTTLAKVIEKLREPQDFRVGDVEEGKAVNDDPYLNGTASYYNDIKMANKGRVEAIERLKESAVAGGKAATVFNAEGKAMTEGTQAQGGYLVQKHVERQIVEARESDNVLRDLCSKLNVSSNEIELNNITLGTTAGWVAELAAKPESTSLSLATVTASIFTAAGLATISNQLLADSDPAVDALVTRDIAKRLVALEETAFLTGSGTGQPLGILNTPGLSATTLTSTSVSAAGGLLDAILDAIGQVQTNFGQPSAILLHPRTWTRILKDKDSQGHYTVGAPTVSDARATTQKTLFGTTVVISNRVPSNLGTATNESRVIVGDFSEALILDRQGITVDESPHVLFTSNQTVFRAEQRVGFTAARQPLAFSVVGGAGLAGG